MATALVVLFVLAFGCSGLATWAALSAPVDESIEARLQREMAVVRRLYTTQPLSEAARLIQLRERRPAGFEFRLTDRQGRVAVGDLPGAAFDLGLSTLETPPLASPKSITDDSDEADEDVGRRIRILADAMPDGAQIALGEDLGRTRELKSLFLRTFILTSGAALMIALAAALSYVTLLLGRIEQIARTADAVSGRDLGVRAPVRSLERADDIDRLALSVNRMLDRIADLLAGVRRVSDDVAHDLRTPLTHLKQRVETALAEPPSLHGYRTALEGASEKMDEVLATFEALLSIAEMEAGSGRAVFQPVDLAAVAADVVEAYRPSAEDGEQKLELRTVLTATVMGQRPLITQMLANLVANALIHTPSGACVLVGVEPGVSGGARLTVSDDGPGVPDAERQMIFRRFYRVDQSRTTPGSGLGLSLVAAIASIHGAEVQAEDADPGLRIVVDFPSPDEHPN